MCVFGGFGRVSDSFEWRRNVVGNTMFYSRRPSERYLIIRLGCVRGATHHRGSHNGKVCVSFLRTSAQTCDMLNARTYSSRFMVFTHYVRGRHVNRLQFFCSVFGFPCELNTLASTNPHRVLLSRAHHFPTALSQCY